MKPRKKHAAAVLFLSGQREHDHYQVGLRRKTVNLRHAELLALIDLILARANSDVGFVKIPSLVIFRLRRAMDKAAGKGAGAALIETGCAEEYRLTMPRAELKKLVAVDPTFFELEGLKVISAEQAKELRPFLRSKNPREIKKKSKRN